MKHAIATGTDTAMICFFDPAALPADFDERVRRDQWKFFGELAREGRLWYQETGSDGGFLFHFYVDEEIPGAIAKHASEPQATERFNIPGGTLWACGAEFAARDPLKAGLAKFNHMGGCVTVPPGTYSLTAWRVEWPEDLEQKELEKRAGKNIVRRSNLLAVLGGMLFLGSLVATFAVAIGILKALGGSLPRHLFWLGGGALLGWAICLPLMRLVTRMEKDPVRREVMMEFPGIVVQMKQLK
jgi:hypothetical protein